MKPVLKEPVTLGFLVLVGLFIVGLAYRSITHHYYPAFEPSESSATARISTAVLFIAAAVFYGLAILGLLLARRSWIDVLVLGGVLFVFRRRHQLFAATSRCSSFHRFPWLLGFRLDSLNSAETTAEWP